MRLCSAPPGNAKTQRNHNSSRFGKYISIRFDEEERRKSTGDLKLVGAAIETYLLEKSRIVYQLQGERCYHIFYLMLKGGTPEQMQGWALTKAEDYHYLNTSGMIEVPQLDDKAEFAEFCSACDAMDLLASQRDQLLDCMAGLLHLGNVEFEEGSSAGPAGAMSPRGSLGGVTEGGVSASGVQKNQQVRADCAAAAAEAAKHLGLQEESLKAALTTRKMVTSRAGETETFLVQLDGLKCVYTRDALTKAVYSSLFEWTVKFLNSKLDSDKGGAGAPFIGILDIFGFESFATNGLEQLLINFANERLQATFNSHVFAAEQELYAQEGISWKSVTWPDNSGCISLISQKERGKTPGLLHLLDEMGRLPKATDPDLCKRLHDSHSGNAFFPRPDPRKVKEVFNVLHYAGVVSYSVAGFLDKNNDTVPASRPPPPPPAFPHLLPPPPAPPHARPRRPCPCVQVNKDLLDLCVHSSNPLLAMVFSDLSDQATPPTATATATAPLLPAPKRGSPHCRAARRSPHPPPRKRRAAR